mmetsp:Transcript_4753/g.10382  ORF Transcript_4753/g.10382 Transcript_4753/m.10382 type:complete len:226 (+) Transcript_4753:63-740(+)
MSRLSRRRCALLPGGPVGRDPSSRPNGSRKSATPWARFASTGSCYVSPTSYRRRSYRLPPLPTRVAWTASADPLSCFLARGCTSDARRRRAATPCGSHSSSSRPLWSTRPSPSSSSRQACLLTPVRRSTFSATTPQLCRRTCRSVSPPSTSCTPPGACVSLSLSWACCSGEGCTSSAPSRRYTSTSPRPNSWCLRTCSMRSASAKSDLVMQPERLPEVQPHTCEL